MPTCGTIEVIVPFDPANVSVSACAASGEVTPGEQVDVTLTVQNDNNTGANATVDLLMDGNSLSTQNTTVAANGSQELTFAVDTSGLSPGEYQFTAGVQQASRA